MTAYADLSTALQAINKGEVYRFLVKPWVNEELIRTVSEGLARFRVLTTLHGEDEAILRSLAQTIELKDHYTRGHCERVAVYALTISEELKLSPQVQLDIRHGSWLHDCGKIGVPETVLNSAEKLSVQDWEVVRKHPEWGATVAEQANLSARVINIIRHHHERFDGTGYPSALKGEAIPLEARIVAVADVYDALRTERPYKKAHDENEAQSILIGMKGSVLDHSLVDLFLATVAIRQTRELP
jgi:putative nucleotidyltransferase with HDIG domain